MFRAFAACRFYLAELAVVPGLEFAAADIGEFRSRFQDGFRPMEQIRLVHLIGTDIFPAWLEDCHPDGIDIIDSVVDLQCAEGIAHHLRVVLSFHKDTESVFEIDDVKNLVSDDEAVPGSETVWHPS